MSATLDVAAVRRHFPALGQKQVYFDSVSKYLASSNAQLGGTYPVSKTSADLFARGCEAVAKFINASPDEVVSGPSTTQLFRNLSVSLYEYINPGDEIIVSKLDHEANISSWVQLAKDRSATLKWYTPTDKKNPQLEPDTLRSIMSPRTKFVAVTHTSNILGTINDIKAIAKTVHEVPDALLCVDAVAYAPHRAIDVKDLEVDFYCFSWYKVYGPHIATLYASKAAQRHLRSLGPFFKDTNSLENMLDVAGGSYELVASIPEVCKYLRSVPWDQIAEHEEKIQKILIDYLLSKPDTIQIWGEPVADRTKRVPVVSFTVKGRSSKAIIEAIESKSDFGCKCGAFYSNRLVEEVLGLDQKEGVVRVSMLHYNTEEEIRGYVKVLNEVLSS